MENKAISIAINSSDMRARVGSILAEGSISALDGRVRFENLVIRRVRVGEKAVQIPSPDEEACLDCWLQKIESVIATAIRTIIQALKQTWYVVKGGQIDKHVVARTSLNGRRFDILFPMPQ